MTITDKAKEIISNIRHMNDADAEEYLRAHLMVVHNKGVASGLEQARQAMMHQLVAAE